MSNMEFGRMYEPYTPQKVSENFDVSLNESSSHPAFMNDQNTFGGFEPTLPSHVDVYSNMNPMNSAMSPHEQPQSVPMQPQTIYQMVGQQGTMQQQNAQFQHNNMYNVAISQHGPIMTTQATGYMGQGCVVNPVYTRPTVINHGPHPLMVNSANAMHGSPTGIFYHRQPGAKTGNSPHNSGGSPSPGSEDSDDSQQKGKRPSPEMTSLDAAPTKVKKPRVSKKGKKKKDPNEPSKPVSAYALFFRDTQATIKVSNPNASFGEVSKLVASMWDSLDAENKGHYKKKTEAAKKEYLKALAAYRASLVSNGTEGDGMYQGHIQGGYNPQFAANNPQYGYPNSANSGTIPQQSTQPIPIGKQSPGMNPMLNNEQSLMNPPMSQPMPPSSMRSHGSNMTPNMGGSPPNMGGSPPNMVSQITNMGQPSMMQQNPHLNQMGNIHPPTSPFMHQVNNPPLGSPISNIGNDAARMPSQQANQPQLSPTGNHMHPIQHPHPNQPQPHSNQSHPHQSTAHNTMPNTNMGAPNNTKTSDNSAPINSQDTQAQPSSNPANNAAPTSSTSASNTTSNGALPGSCAVTQSSCIRAGCSNPAVRNAEWEDEYCSNECVVSHCRDVFNNWVASGQNSVPCNAAAPVK